MPFSLASILMFFILAIVLFCFVSTLPPPSAASQLVRPAALGNLQVVGTSGFYKYEYKRAGLQSSGTFSYFWRPKILPCRPALGALPFGSQAFQLSSLLAYPPCCGCKRGIRPATGAPKKNDYQENSHVLERSTAAIVNLAPCNAVSAEPLRPCIFSAPGKRLEPEILIADSGSGLV
jgi:hypothetical protein